jgi:hypothetical protein
MGGGGGIERVGEESSHYDREKSWPSINHLVISVLGILKDKKKVGN